jgi:TolA-binding protein
MSWSDTAKEALSYAVKAAQAIAEVKAIVQQLQISAQNHEQRTNARIDALESRIRELDVSVESRIRELDIHRQQSAQSYEQRTNSRVDSLDSRTRELERELAKVSGQVSGGFSQAMALVLREHARTPACQKPAEEEFPALTGSGKQNS